MQLVFEQICLLGSNVDLSAQNHGQMAIAGILESRTQNCDEALGCPWFYEKAAVRFRHSLHTVVVIY